MSTLSILLLGGFYLERVCESYKYLHPYKKWLLRMVREGLNCAFSIILCDLPKKFSEKIISPVQSHVIVVTHSDLKWSHILVQCGCAWITTIVVILTSWWSRICSYFRLVAILSTPTTTSRPFFCNGLLSQEFCTLIKSKIPLTSRPFVV